MTNDLRNKIGNIISRNADDKEVVFQLKQMLHKFELQNYNVKDVKNIADLATENICQLKDKVTQNAVIKSGFDDFDSKFYGFFPGEFVVVGGRPAMGKTQFLINLSLNISQSIPVLYVTLELSEESLTNRFISSVTQTPITNILAGDLCEESENRLSTVGNEFAKRKLFILDGCNTSIEALMSNFQKQIQENGVKVIIIDYLQLLYSNKNIDNRNYEMSYICREIKNLGRENNVLVIASSQLNRGVEHRTGIFKHPQLCDLRECGSIEQDADKVIFVHRYECYGLTEDQDGNSLRNLAIILMAKNRTGQMGGIYLSRDEAFTNFMNFENRTNPSYL